MKKETTIIIITILVIVAILGGGYVLSSKNSAPQANNLSPTPDANAITKPQAGSNQPLPISSPSAMPSNNKSKTLSKPSMMIDKSKTYTAILHTSDGDITIALDAKDTPITVNNFVYLSREHFYEGSPFHRVIAGFMIQGGDPTGTGTGGPGYKFDDEQFSGEYTRGTVAMANAGPNTNGSQFFIMHQDNPLPKNYVIFGKVSAGMDVVDKIATAPVKASPMGENSSPINPVTIKSVDITEE